VVHRVILEALYRSDAAMGAGTEFDDNWVAFDRIFDNFKSLNNPEDDLRRSQLQTERVEVLAREAHMNENNDGRRLNYV